MGQAGPWHKTQTALARALGRSLGWVTASKRKPGFPKKGKRGWDEAKVRAWIRDQPPGRRQLPEPPKGGVKKPKRKPRKPRKKRTKKAAAPPAETEDRAAECLRALREATEPVELARAGMQLAAERVAQAFEGGGSMASELPNLTKAVTAMRLAEAAAIELGQKRGELIPKDVAMISGAAIAQGFVRALQGLETSLAAQVEVWLSNASFRERRTAERRREVTAWIRDQGAAVRSNAHSYFGQVLEAALEERAKAAAEKRRRK